MTAFCGTDRDSIKQLICRVADGEDVDTSSLGEEETNYVKTAKVLLGHSLYSDSWLQL